MDLKKSNLNDTQDITPLLKYLRGNDFTDRHWREVFNLLEMEYKKSDTLKVKDFLIAAANIKKHIKKLQVKFKGTFIHNHDFEDLFLFT